MDDVTRIEVQAGIQRIFRGTPTYRSIVQAGRNIRVHPQYNSETLLNDIALIFLVNRIPMNDVMQRIALPPRSHANNRFVGFFGIVIGWGRFNDGRSTSLSYFTLLHVAFDKIPELVLTTLLCFHFSFPKSFWRPKIRISTDNRRPSLWKRLQSRLSLFPTNEHLHQRRKRIKL